MRSAHPLQKERHIYLHLPINRFKRCFQISVAFMASANQSLENGNSVSEEAFTLESIRESLIRQEDTIVFNLIERAKFPRNPSIYDESSSKASAFGGSLLKFFVKEAEIVHAKVGRYESPEERPFFPDDLPSPLSPSKHPQVLHPKAANININKTIWDMYINRLLPLFTDEGDDGNYASTVACDLACLQAISRRIHCGMFVAEVKFRDAPEEYSRTIRSQDGDALMKMLTFKKVEEMVKRRVEKKASVFGQEVRLDDKADEAKCKINPSVLVCLYDEWMMPLTKDVEVDYLLHRLDG